MQHQITLETVALAVRLFRRPELRRRTADEAQAFRIVARACREAAASMPPMPCSTMPTPVAHTLDQLGAALLLALDPTHHEEAR